MPLSTLYYLEDVYGERASLDVKIKDKLLKVCYVSTTNATFLAFLSFFLAVAINSTNEANKAGGTHH